MRNLDPLLKSKSTGLFAPGHSTEAADAEALVPWPVCQGLPLCALTRTGSCSIPSCYCKVPTEVKVTGAQEKTRLERRTTSVPAQP